MIPNQDSEPDLSITSSGMDTKLEQKLKEEAMDGLKEKGDLPAPS